MATQTQVKAFIERIAPIAQAKSKGGHCRPCVLHRPVVSLHMGQVLR